jgi:hypothetical protein
MPYGLCDPSGRRSLYASPGPGHEHQEGNAWIARRRDRRDQPALTVTDETTTVAP